MFTIMFTSNAEFRIKLTVDRDCKAHHKYLNLENDKKRVLTLNFEEPKDLFYKFVF